MMMIDQSNTLQHKDSSTEKSFYLYFSLQFLLIVMGMFMDVKTGVFTLLLTLIMTPVILGRCSSKQFDFSPAKNGMMFLFILPGIYYFFELSNPNNVQEAWNVSIAPYWLYPFLLAIIVPVAIIDKTGIEKLLII